MIVIDSQMVYNVGMVKRTCERCQRDFLAFPSRINKWGARYCSRDCSNKSTALRGDKSPHWVGDKVGYYGIHDWLYTNFGKAVKCEKCGIKKNIQWSKLSGKEYERKRENFWQLCARCHIFYDETLPNSTGRPVSKETREKISKSLKGRKRLW